MADFPGICQKIQNVANYRFVHSNKFNDNMALFFVKWKGELVQLIEHGRICDMTSTDIQEVASNVICSHVQIEAVQANQPWFD